MATNFPTSVDDASSVFDGTHRSADEALSSTTGGPAHHALHQNVGLAINAIEDKVGTGASTPAANTVLTGTGSGTSAWATVSTAMIGDDQVTAAKVADDAVTKVVVTDTTDPTAFPALFQSATGNLTPHTDAGLTYNASNGTLTATAFEGPLTGNVTGNQSGGSIAATTLTASGDANFDSGTLFVDVSENRVGISNTTPSYELDVTGAIRATGNVRAEGDLYVGKNGGGDSRIYFYDDNSDATRVFFWDDSENRFHLAGNTNVQGTLNVTDITGDSITLSAGAAINGVLDANGVVKIIDGSASTPALTFDSDEDTGLFSNTTGQINVTTAGTKRVTVDNTGNIYLDTDLGTYVAVNPTTGTGNDAEWAFGFGVYSIKRNSSTAAEKENISADLGSHLTADMIDSVVPKMWNRITAPGYPEIGPIADEIDEVSPFLAAHGTDADSNEVLTGINKTAWMSLMTLALQDIRTRLEALEG